MMMTAILYVLLLTKVAKCGDRNESDAGIYANNLTNGGSYEEPERDVTLNFSSPDEEAVHVERGGINGVLCAFFSPNNGFAIKEVTYGPEVIWNADETSKCTRAELFTFGPYAVSVIGLNDDGMLDFKYYEKEAGRWRLVTPFTFNLRLYSMMARHPNRAPDAG
ncbi:signal peptide containing protein [Theileria equi strain WA]|uniref:Signal peptide containing protein n=1 Tax=Theileria equi strain WA TaxID=1537102 RepID=L1LBA1_THEEQ|nr:signal peptide containing protein [Theileria equi strain WA]EKX72438.1 signal peptide containing protein [Theileria equi strain WA]|eukprot:XP_004831890.1 signal peptide containing protein [Theileria equi strain WA]